MNGSLDVLKAAVDFAKADQEYLDLINKLVHPKNAMGGGKNPSPEDLKRLAVLRAKRNELEERFFTIWIGEGWRSERSC